MSSQTVFAVIVVYNKFVEESVAVQCLRSLIDNRCVLLVVDNSETWEHNESYCMEQGIAYVAMKGNAGISRAYNVAIECFSGVAAKDDVLLLTDDDTNIPGCYLEDLERELDARANASIDIFAPVVMGQDGVIYSPNYSRFVKNRLLQDRDEQVPQDSFNAISSCLAVRFRVFDDFRFVEDLFVDQVDQFFFDQMRAAGRSFKKVNTIIEQNFHQRGTTLDPESGWARLCLRIADIFVHARLRGGGMYTVLAFAKTCGLGLQIARKANDPTIAIKALPASVCGCLKAKRADGCVSFK